MKLNNTIELDAFNKAIAACADQVWLVSPDGDKFNLSSVFSRYIALGALLSENGDKLELFCDNKADEGNFFKFFKENPDVL